MSTTLGRRHIYINPDAQDWVCDTTLGEENILKFHQQLPGFAPTRLVPLTALARELGVKQVWVKDETS